MPLLFRYLSCRLAIEKGGGVGAAATGMSRADQGRPGRPGMLRQMNLCATRAHSADVALLKEITKHPQQAAQHRLMATACCSAPDQEQRNHIAGPAGCRSMQRRAVLGRCQVHISAAFEQQLRGEVGGAKRAEGLDPMLTKACKPP